MDRRFHAIATGWGEGLRGYPPMEEGSWQEPAGGYGPGWVKQAVDGIKSLVKTYKQEKRLSQ